MASNALRKNLKEKVGAVTVLASVFLSGGTVPVKADTTAPAAISETETVSQTQTLPPAITGTQAVPEVITDAQPENLDEVVTFKDPVVENIIRKSLNRVGGGPSLIDRGIKEGPVTRRDLNGIVDIDFSAEGIQTYEDVSLLSNAMTIRTKNNINNTNFIDCISKIKANNINVLVENENCTDTSIYEPIKDKVVGIDVKYYTKEQLSNIGKLNKLFNLYMTGNKQITDFKGVALPPNLYRVYAEESVFNDVESLKNYPFEIIYLSNDANMVMSEDEFNQIKHNMYKYIDRTGVDISIKGTPLYNELSQKKVNLNCSAEEILYERNMCKKPGIDMTCADVSNRFEIMINDETIKDLNLTEEQILLLISWELNRDCITAVNIRGLSNINVDKLIEKGIVNENTKNHLVTEPEQLPSKCNGNLNGYTDLAKYKIKVRELKHATGLGAPLVNIQDYAVINQEKINKIKEYGKLLDSDLFRVVFTGYMSQAVTVMDKRSYLQEAMKGVYTDQELAQIYKAIDEGAVETTNVIAKLLGTSVEKINDNGIEKLKITKNGAECIFDKTIDDAMNFSKVKSNEDITQIRIKSIEYCTEYSDIFATKSQAEKLDMVVKQQDEYIKSLTQKPTIPDIMSGKGYYEQKEVVKPIQPVSEETTQISMSNIPDYFGNQGLETIAATKTVSLVDPLGEYKTIDIEVDENILLG